MALLELLQPLVTAITSWISSLGYIGIFGLMVLESALIPIPSEIIMPFSGYLASTGRFEPWAVVLAGTLGNLVGSVLTYYLGLKAGRALILRYGRYVLFRESHLRTVEGWFSKYGDRTAFIGRLLPGVRTYVSLPAGIGEMRIGRFVVYTFVGSLIWNSMLTFVGMQLGENWKNIDKYSIYLDLAAAAAVLGFVIWFVRASRSSGKDPKARQPSKEKSQN
ncbi:MAG: DedA family protein [Nitrososphaera sp.]|jgi:membrane protein DedA with SNARE-associated domain